MPRVDDRRCAGERKAHQLPDQSRRRQRGRSGSAGRGSAQTGQGKVRHNPGMGNQAGGGLMPAYRKISVLMGGRSAEREVSLSSGRGVVKALREEGFDATSLDPGDNPGQQLFEAKPDAVFNALHGRFGEDGTVQGLLELMRIPYTHSGVLSSALAMHKERTKDIYRAAGLPVVKSIVADRHALAGTHLMEPPYGIKPVNEGSSVGIYIIRKG